MRLLVSVFLGALVFVPALMAAESSAEDVSGAVPGVTIAEPNEGWIELPPQGLFPAPAAQDASRDDPQTK